MVRRRLIEGRRYQAGRLSTSPITWSPGDGFTGPHSRSAVAICAFMLGLLSGCAPPPTARPQPASILEAGVHDAEAIRVMESLDLEAIERQVLVRVNAERAKRNLPAFRRDGPLENLARAHSADMAQAQFFSHTNPRGEDPTQRGAARGIECVRPAGENRMAVGLGENIFSTYLFTSIYTTRRGDDATQTYTWKSVDTLSEEAMEGWMNSRGHRLNLLSRQYQTIGIGAARDALGQLYLTQNFC